MVGQGLRSPGRRAFILPAALPSLERMGVGVEPGRVELGGLPGAGPEAAPATSALTLLEANVDSSSAVGEAVNSLIARGAQAIWMGGDNTVNAAVVC